MSVFTDLQLIRQQNPLIHNMTNFVVMNQTANALLAIGVSLSEDALHLTAQAYVQVNNESKKLLLEKFSQDVCLEYQFWDDAYYQCQLYRKTLGMLEVGR